MTRNPKSGKGRKWTVAELKAIPPTWQGDALSDGDGLVGTVRVNAAGAVSLHFRYGFKTGAKRSWHYCGTWPASSLESIRTVRNEARATLRGRINSNAQRSAGRIEEQRRIREVHEAEAQRATQDLPLQAMFDAWIADGVMRKDGNTALRRLFQKDLLPHLGTRPVKEITEHELRAVLRQVVARGANRLAVVLHNDVRQMFAWAETRQPWRRLLQEGNPAVLIEIDKIVAPDYDLTNVRTRTLSSAEVDVLDGSRVRRHYLMHKYSSETKQAWQKLGAAIEASLQPERPAAPAAVSTRNVYGSTTWDACVLGLPKVGNVSALGVVPIF